MKNVIPPCISLTNYFYAAAETINKTCTYSYQKPSLREIVFHVFQAKYSQ